MAAENYIRDLSEYLTSGNLSDLTLNFGEKTWHVHKALVCCHSKWFQRAITGGYEETFSGVVTLKDDPEFADAIDCMVSYFYKAGYNATMYDTSESLLHVQVATLAEKYDCASLYKLARTAFEDTVKTVESDDWVAVSSFIYNHTIMEVPAHVELRDLIVAAVVGRRSMLKSILRKESMVELLRSNADLATDLLLSGPDGPKAKHVSQQIFTCSNCHYAHAGPRNCPYIAYTTTDNSFLNWKACPQCGFEPRIAPRRYTNMSDIFSAFPCPSCDGIHTTSPNQSG